jgi:two-component system, chemotaxis family, CheB/CheR fusion protein
VHRLGRHYQPLAYGLAVVLAIGAILLRWALTPVVGPGSPYLLAFPAVALSGWFGGFGPGLVATICGAATAAVVFRNTSLQTTPHLAFSALVFLLAGALISHLCQLLHREWARANNEARRLAESLAVRECMEQRLRDSEERHRGIVDNVEALIYVKDLDGRIVSTNQHFERALGLKAGDVIGKTDFDYCPPEFAEVFRANDRKVVETGQCITFQEQAPLPDGLHMFVSVKFPLRDSNGRVCAVCGVSTDITDQKRQEEELRRRRDELRLITNAVPALISYMDADYRYRWTNDTYARWFGRSSDEIAGRHLRDVLGEAAWERIEPYARRAMAGEVVNYEQELPYAVAGPKWVHVTYTPDRAEDGTVRGVVVLVTDIGAAKLAEEDLRKAKAAAEEANAAKDHFLAALSHELRTPLSPVLMAATELERDQSLPAQVRESAGVIRRNAELEARLIDDLLDLTRITRGKLQLNRQIVDICHVVGQTVDVCQPELREQKLQLSTDIQPGRFFVNGDPARLQQVLWNLLKNAVKFSKPGGRIEIRCLPIDDGSAVAIEVKDEGIGMDAATLARVFNAFEQGGMHITRQFGGLGLGLAISRAITEQHGGRIEAHSQGPGAGAVFRVTLPLTKVPAVPAHAPDQPATPVVARRILIVEDHPETARLMSRLLRLRGHEVSTADSVASARELISEEMFDVLVSDVGLPDGNGTELMQHALALGRNLKGIALSGYGMEDDIRRSREAGFSEHLVKPVDLDVLTRTIDRLTLEPAQG